MSAVDAALSAWRTETVQRRAVWDLRAEEDAAEQARRRSLFLRMASLGAGSTFALAGLAAGVVWAWMPAAAPPIALAATPTLPVIGDGPSIAVTRDAVDLASAKAGGAADPRHAGVAPATAELGLLGPAITWRANGGLWVQLDYRGEEISLQWMDAAGNAVLESTPCVNRVGDVRRCYVGRTARRVQSALDAGAVPGAWTTNACRDGACVEIARWDVR